MEEARVHEHLRRHHYLGLRVVGENLKYLIPSSTGEDLACLLFGAAAWQSAARDQFIGWSAAQRAQGLGQVTNNTRFLILPIILCILFAAFLSLFALDVFDEHLGFWKTLLALAIQLVRLCPDFRPVVHRGHSLPAELATPS